MNDRVTIPSEQGPIARLAEIQIVQFIRDGLRAGERALLVTGHGAASGRVPDAALADSHGQTLHIGRPLPEPYELQRMIGEAAGIAGGGEMAPLAFIARLLFAARESHVILAIDDAHLLSHRSLAYLGEITELLAPDAPILQIVLAARPLLLDTLAQPEFESFRSRLIRPAFETLPAPPEAEEGEPAVVAAGGAERAAARQTIRPDETLAASPKVFALARLAAQAAAGLTALGCLAAIVYVALPAVSDRLIRRPTPSLHAASPQALMTPSDPSRSPARFDPKEAGGVADRLIDSLADAVANGPAESVAVLIERVATLEASASPEGLRLVTAMPDRFAARAIAAAAAGRVDEARRLEQFLLLTSPGRVRLDLLGTSDPTKSFPAPPSFLARATPTEPESRTPPSVEQSSAADSDPRAAVSPEAPAPSQSAATAPNGDSAPLKTAARATPTAPERPAAQREGLPAMAPVRVVLDVARNEIGPAGRAADIRQALVAAGLEVAKLVPVDEHRSGPSVGYYFQSDRKAAAGVSRVLEPLIGAVTPVALRARGNVPEPGTIEIVVR